MGKALVPHTVLGCLRQLCNQMHRLTGGYLTIKNYQLRSNDSSFAADGAVKLRFTNRGTTTVVLDENEFLLPGEVWVEGDDTGPGIDHVYSIRFLASAPSTGGGGNDGEKAADDVEIRQDGFVVRSTGNFLQVRVMKRNY